MLQKTPLNAVHRAAGARMVDFGGWDMPVHYGSQIEEHHAVRRGAGMFDVSHMRVLDLEAPGARDFLRYALANNVDKLKTAGKALYACMLNPEGGVIDDLIAYFLREDWFRIVVNAGTADKDVVWLRTLLERHAPELVLRVREDLGIIAVQGPDARAKVWEALPQVRVATAELKPFSAAIVDDLFIARTGYTGEDGFEIVLPATRLAATWQALAAVGVRACGLGARDTLRLEAGMNLYGQDMDERTSPLESGLAWTVDLAAPRDFVGKEALQARAPALDQMGLLLVSRGGMLRAHQAVRTAHGDGEITSGSFSPTLERSIALARLPRAVAPGDVVQVVVRDREQPARVIKPPFARHGKSLIQLEEIR